MDRHKNRTLESEAARKRESRSAASDVAADLDAALPLVDWRRRSRCAKSLRAFASVYCTGEGGFLEDAPPPSMRGILDEMQTAICDASIPYHIRIARGHGKTSFMKCAVAYVLSYGIRRYVVSVSADARKSAAIVSDIVAFMTSSPKWCQDFPEVSVPLLRLGGAYQRAKSQTCRGENTDIRLSAGEMRLPTVTDEKTGERYASSGAILCAVGLTGNVRGLVRGSRRPDLLLLDDLQNDEMAGNEERVQEAALRIRKAFMGLAGHRRKIAAIMTSTPIAPDDLSETFAADRAWKTTTHRMVKSFPDCFGADRGDLWREYAEICQKELLEGRRPHVEGNRFYRRNRAAMDAGAEVLNPRNYDPKTELSAVQHALNIYFRDGQEAFMAEYQMEPPRNAFAFEISAQLVLQRVRRGVPPNTLPPDTVLTVAATDINPGYAITTAVVAFDVRRTAFVTVYHATPVKISERLNDTEFGARVFAALKSHGREIAALGVRIDRWGIDAGGRQFQTVTRFAAMAESETGLPAVAMLGRAGQNWNPNVRSRIRGERNATVLCRDAQRRTWIAWNADEYKEAAQRAWATETGAAGGLSLFDGGANHYRFAVQIANEKLRAKTRTRSKDGRDCYAYRWQTKNPHDYGDCVAMAYALAGAEGLTGDGETAPARRKTGLAIGGRVIGGTPPPSVPPTAEEAGPQGGGTPPPAAPRRRAHRIAIGGRLV